jgi:peptide chain release factor 1
VSDHRVNVDVYNLDAVLGGDLDDFTAALQAEEKRRRLEEQAGE